MKRRQRPERRSRLRNSPASGSRRNQGSKKQGFNWQILEDPIGMSRNVSAPEPVNRADFDKWLAALEDKVSTIDINGRVTVQDVLEQIFHEDGSYRLTLPYSLTFDYYKKVSNVSRGFTYNAMIRRRGAYLFLSALHGIARDRGIKPVLMIGTAPYKTHDDLDMPCILNDMKARFRRTWIRRHPLHTVIAIKDESTITRDGVIHDSADLFVWPDTPQSEDDYAALVKEAMDLWNHIVSTTNDPDGKPMRVTKYTAHAQVFGYSDVSYHFKAEQIHKERKGKHMSRGDLARQKLNGASSSERRQAAALLHKLDAANKHQEKLSLPKRLDGVTALVLEADDNRKSWVPFAHAIASERNVIASEVPVEQEASQDDLATVTSIVGRRSASAEVTQVEDEQGQEQGGNRIGTQGEQDARVVDLGSRRRSGSSGLSGHRIGILRQGHFGQEDSRGVSQRHGVHRMGQGSGDRQVQEGYAAREQSSGLVGLRVGDLDRVQGESLSLLRTTRWGTKTRDGFKPDWSETGTESRRAA